MEEAYTSVGTRARAAASNTRALPLTLVASMTSTRCDGWINQARWTTTSAPRQWGSRSSDDTSAAAQVTLGISTVARRRATPSTEPTAGSAERASTTLVPTLPVAPNTTTRMVRSLPLFSGHHGAHERARTEGRRHRHGRGHAPRARRRRDVGRNAGRAFGRGAHRRLRPDRPARPLRRRGARPRPRRPLRRARRPAPRPLRPA